jgi:hypothetical protein
MPTIGIGAADDKECDGILDFQGERRLAHYEFRNFAPFIAVNEIRNEQGKDLPNWDAGLPSPR